jgi:hypothetical protein
VTVVLTAVPKTSALMPPVSVRLVDVTPEDTVMVVIARVPLAQRRRSEASGRPS